MKLLDLFESPNEQQVIVIFAGRFQPIHLGHKAVYDHLVSFFGPNVFIATGDKIKIPNSPFNFEQKQILAGYLDIPEDHVIMTPQPYRPVQITTQFDSRFTRVVFALGAKDADRFDFEHSRDSDYMQPYQGTASMDTLDQHGYVYIIPTQTFMINDVPIQSASEIRAAYADADSTGRSQIIRDLYGTYNHEIRDIFDTALRYQGLSEGRIGNFFSGIALAGILALGMPASVTNDGITQQTIAASTAYVHDIKLLALTIWGEARNQGQLGMAAIGHVIMNRINHHDKKYGDDMQSVVLNPHQFSCWSDSDQNKEKIIRMSLIDQAIQKQEAPNGVDYNEWFAELKKTPDWADYQAWTQAYKIAEYILKGRSSDPTHGATMYHTENSNPKWAHKVRPTVQIGSHIFYKDFGK